MSNLIQQKYVTLMIQYQLLKWQWLLAVQVLYFICANAGLYPSTLSLGHGQGGFFA